MDAVRRDEIAANLREVRERIATACARAGRDPAEVQLIAVTKTWPVEDVRILADLGITDVGENRDQEAAPKAAAFAAQDGRPLRWHFIGQLQSNKARSVVRYASMVHTVDRASLAAALAKAAPDGLDILVQLSVDGDPARGGVPVAELPALVAGLPPSLRLQGVMAVAPLGVEAGDAFGLVAQAHELLLRQFPQARVRCMGMSEDLEAAIACGATHIRVGSALLGHRTVR